MSTHYNKIYLITEESLVMGVRYKKREGFEDELALLNELPLGEKVQKVIFDELNIRLNEIITVQHAVTMDHQIDAEIITRNGLITTCNKTVVTTLYILNKRTSIKPKFIDKVSYFSSTPLEFDEKKEVLSSILLIDFGERFFVMTDGTDAYHVISRYVENDFGIDVAEKICNGDMTRKSVNYVSSEIVKQFSVLKGNSSFFNHQESVEYIKGYVKSEYNDDLTKSLIEFGIPISFKNSNIGIDFLEKTISKLNVLLDDNYPVTSPQFSIPRFKKLTDFSLIDKLNERVDKYYDSDFDFEILFWDFAFDGYDVSANNVIRDMGEEVTINSIRPSFVGNEESEEVIQKVSSATTIEELKGVVVEEKIPISKIKISIDDGGKTKVFHLKDHINMEIRHNATCYILMNKRWYIANEYLLNGIDSRIVNLHQEEEILYIKELNNLINNENNIDNSSNLYRKFIDYKQKMHVKYNMACYNLENCKCERERTRLKNIKVRSQVYNEYVYNKLLCDKKQWILLDRLNLKIAGSKIELADCYNWNNNELIAVKIDDLSSSSYVFDQIELSLFAFSEKKSRNSQIEKAFEDFVDVVGIPNFEFQHDKKFTFTALIGSKNNHQLIENIERDGLVGVNSLMFKMKLLSCIEKVRASGNNFKMILCKHKYK